MPKEIFTNFSGGFNNFILPTQLGKNMAQNLQSVDLRKGGLTPMPAPVTTETFPSVVSTNLVSVDKSVIDWRGTLIASDTPVNYIELNSKLYFRGSLGLQRILQNPTDFTDVEAIHTQVDYSNTVSSYTTGSVAWPHPTSVQSYEFVVEAYEVSGAYGNRVQGKVEAVETNHIDSFTVGNFDVQYADGQNPYKLRIYLKKDKLVDDTSGLLVADISHTEFFYIGEYITDPSTYANVRLKFDLENLSVDVLDTSNNTIYTISDEWAEYIYPKYDDSYVTASSMTSNLIDLVSEDSYAKLAYSGGRLFTVGKANKLYYSEPLEYAVWSELNFLEFDTAIHSVVAVDQGVLVLSERATYLVRGYDEATFTVLTISDTLGCILSNSIATDGSAVLWLSERGVIAYGQYGIKKLTDERFEFFYTPTASSTRAILYANEYYLKSRVDSIKLDLSKAGVPLVRLDYSSYTGWYVGYDNKLKWYSSNGSDITAIGEIPFSGAYDTLKYRSPYFLFSTNNRIRLKEVQVKCEAVLDTSTIHIGPGADPYLIEDITYPLQANDVTVCRLPTSKQVHDGFSLEIIGKCEVTGYTLEYEVLSTDGNKQLFHTMTIEHTDAVTFDVLDSSDSVIESRSLAANSTGRTTLVLNNPTIDYYVTISSDDTNLVDYAVAAQPLNSRLSKFVSIYIEYEGDVTMNLTHSDGSSVYANPVELSSNSLKAELINLPAELIDTDLIPIFTGTVRYYEFVRQEALK